MKPVMLPPGRARLSTKPPPTGSMALANTIGTVRVARCSACVSGPPAATSTSGASATSSAAYLRKSSVSPAPPAQVDAQVAANGPAGLRKSLVKGRETRLSLRIVGGEVHKHADAPHPAALLRPRRERPRRRAAEKRDECATFHFPSEIGGSRNK
jgi:hypothetical protein